MHDDSDAAEDAAADAAARPASSALQLKLDVCTPHHFHTVVCMTSFINGHPYWLAVRDARLFIPVEVLHVSPTSISYREVGCTAIVTAAASSAGQVA
jgi:hypothetical protein